MRVMVLVKADKDSEAGVMPSEKLLTDMGKYNEQLVKAGVMLEGEGLHPSSKGVRVRFSGGKRAVIDGPFAEAKEQILGFYVIDCESEDEALSIAGELGRANPGGAFEVRPMLYFDPGSGVAKDTDYLLSDRQ